MKEYYLYRHIRLDKNEPFYVGVGTKRKRPVSSTKTEYERAFSKTDRNKHWINITNKVDYKIEVLLETDSIEYIIEKEIEFIRLYGRKDLNLGTLCNLTDGGEGVINYIWTDEQRQNVSKRLKDKPLSEIHRENIGKAQIGRVMSKETLEKRTLSRKINADERGYYVSPKIKENLGKKVIQLDLNGNQIKVWDSISEAAKTLKLFKGNIISVCKNKNRHKTTGGFKWIYHTII